MGCEDRYRAGRRPGQDRSLEQFVFRHSPGGLRGPACFGRGIRPAPGALLYAVAIVLGVFRRLCAARRVFEHCHKNSGALVGPAVRDHDVSFCGDVDYPGSSRQPQRQVCMDACLPRKFIRGRRLDSCGKRHARARPRAKRRQAHNRGPRVGRARRYIFWGEHFLHPANVPGVPLEKLMPAWIPAHLPISYVTGAILLVAGASILLAKKTRMAATYLGTWIVLLVLFIYGPILIAALADPSTDVKIEGINYFFDTLLFAGAILALASSTPRAD